MPTNRQEVPVKSILLNPKNYRHRPVTTQEEAFSELFADEALRREMYALAEDITANNLDPSSLMIVEPAGKQWRVLEGNRRIAVLRALDNPAVIPASLNMTARALAAYRSRFKKLGGIASVPTKVLCVVTDDLDRANHLIRLKHTNLGAHKGAGTKLWDTEGSTRYEMDLAAAAGRPASASNRQTQNAIAVLDALRVQFDGDDEIIDLIDAARRRGMTTLGRLLIRTDNQLRLGLQIEGSLVRFTVTHDALRVAVHRVLSDLGTSRLNSRSTNRADDVTDYLDSVEADLPSTKDRLDAPKTPASPTGSTGTTKKPVRRRRRVTPLRKVFPGLRLEFASDKTRALLREMQDLRIEDNPVLLSAAVRMLIDLYTADVFDELGKTKEDRPSARARKCLYMLEPQNTRSKDRRFPRIHDAVATQTGDLSIDTMNGFMHRATHYPTPDTIRTQSEYYQPFLDALDAYVHDQLNPPAAKS